MNSKFLFSAFLLLLFAVTFLPASMAEDFNSINTNWVNATKNVTIGTGDITFSVNHTNGNVFVGGSINQTISGNVNRLGLTYMRGAKIRSIGGNGYYTLGALDDAGLLYFENTVDHSGKLVYMVFNLTTESIQIQNPLTIDISDLGLDPDDPVIEIQDGSTSAIFTASQVTVDNADIGGIINGSPTIIFDENNNDNDMFIQVGNSQRVVGGVAQWSDGLCGDHDKLYGAGTKFTEQVFVGDVLTLGSESFDVVEIISDTILRHSNTPSFLLEACSFLSITTNSFGSGFAITEDGFISSSLLPNQSNLYNLGSPSRYWRSLYSTNSHHTNSEITNLYADNLYADNVDTMLPIDVTTNIGSSSSPFWVSYTESVRALDSMCLGSGCIFSWDDVNKSDSDFGNISVEGIQYNITPSCDTDNAPEGFTCWNSDDMTLNIVTGLGNVQQVGQEVYGIGINKGSYALSDGSVVALSGSIGDRFTFIPADSSSAITSSFVGVLTTTCEVNAECPVTVFGQVRGIDTSMWAVNDSLYMNPNEPGNMTNTPPSLPNNPLWIASVIVSHPTQGIIGLVLRNDPNDGFLANDGWFTGNITTQGINNKKNYQSLIDELSRGDTLNVSGVGNIALINTICGYLGTPNEILCGSPFFLIGSKGNVNVQGNANIVSFATGDSTVERTNNVTGHANIFGGVNNVGDSLVEGHGNLVWGTGDFSIDDASKGNIIIGNAIDVIGATGGGAFGQLHDLTADYCYAFGAANTCSASYGFTGGYGNVITGGTATAMGRDNRVSGTYASTSGYRNDVSGAQSVASGRYVNVTDANVYVIGNGENYNTPNNDLVIDYENITVNKFTRFKNTSLINVPHVEVYNTTENGYTLTISSLNTWYNFTSLAMGETNEFTISGNDLTANYGGVYKVDYSVSFSGSGGSTHAISLLINNVEHEPCRVYRKLGTAGDVGNAGGTCLITLASGDVVNGAMKDISSPAQNVDIWSVNANLIRIGEN